MPSPTPCLLPVVLSFLGAVVPDRAGAVDGDVVLAGVEYAESGLDPAAAAARMTVPEGFHVDLIAAEPDLRQPVALVVDERGRLWVAEAHTYPARAPEGAGQDRIVVFEDADGDGSFENRTVFAEGLNLVSGMEVGFGGVWVGAAPHLLFIPDGNGDLVPDRAPETLLDGWGYQDTHETLNSFVWGPDGWLYGCHGVFTHSRVGVPGTPDEERTPINAGFWRYHPTRHTFDVFAWGTSNPWGLDYDARGQFFAEACVIPHFWHVVQGARYQRQGGRHFNPHVYSEIQTIADHRHYLGDTPHSGNGVSDDAGGGHAHCGLLIYQGDQFPPHYRGRPMFFNLHGHRINQENLVRNGSGWTAQHLPDLLLSNDRWSMGIALKMGPDGSVYFIDWYDRQICHRNEPEIWDRSNGRLYRLRFGEPVRQNLDLARLDDVQLASLQVSTNEWHVRNSRRLLQERSAAGSLDQASVAAIFEGILRDRRGDPVHRLRALWALHATGGGTAEVIGLASTDPDEFVRAWAVQLSGESGSGLAATLRLAGSDPSPVVRLYLASLLQKLPPASRWEVAAQLATHGEDEHDPNIPQVLWYGIEPLVSIDPVRALELATRSNIPMVARHIARRAAADQAGLDAAIASMGSAEVEVGFASIIGTEVLTALETRPDLSSPPSWPNTFEALKSTGDPELALRVRDLAVRFGDRSTFPLLRAELASAETSTDERIRIARVLANANDLDAVPVFQRLLAEPLLRTAALQALAGFGDPETAGAILAVFPDLDADEKTHALSALTTRSDYALALMEAVAGGAIERAEISPFAARQMRVFGDAKLDRLIEEHWGRVSADSPEQVHSEIARFRARFTAQKLTDANLQNGRNVFDQTCGICHTLFGTGGQIGPDITGSNRRDLGYLLENLIDPSGVVGNDYLLNTVTTRDGRAVAGMMAGSNDASLTIRQIDGTDVVIPLAEVANREVAPVSVMPPGQLQALPEDDARDLIAYLMSPSQVPRAGEAPILNPETGEVESALEGEELEVRAITGGKAEPQNMAVFGEAKWSIGRHLWWTGAEPGDELVLAFPATAGGRYEVFAGFTKAPDYGVVQITVNGVRVHEEFDLYGSTVYSTGGVSLGTHLLSAANELAFKITGKNPAAVANYMVGLDYIWLRAVE